MTAESFDAVLRTLLNRTPFRPFGGAGKSTRRDFPTEDSKTGTPVRFSTSLSCAARADA